MGTRPGSLVEVVVVWRRRRCSARARGEGLVGKSSGQCRFMPADGCPGMVTDESRYERDRVIIDPSFNSYGDDLMKRAIAAVLCVIAVPLLAQTSASLTGIVSAAGEAIPGATVRIVSPEFQGSRVTTTGDGGAYNFPALPPGQYTITITFAGMGKRVVNATLRLSQVTRADVTMNAITEAITVSAP